MRLLLLTVMFVSLNSRALAQQARAVGDISRSDSIDLLHSRIDLDLTQVGTGIISGRATITLVPKVANVHTLPFDLLQLTVDSVLWNGTPLTFSHPDEVLTIDLGSDIGTTDTITVEVAYHGDPVVDASGWGGFYTTSNYQYDLGVAFDAVPHSFGRAWFPCFDNFVERCTFDLNVRTSNDRTVFANGELVQHDDLGGGLHVYHWHIAEPIPSYLTSVASTNYVAVRDSFPSVSGELVPVILAARPNDTTAMKSSFTHLRNAFDTYERWFGPYRWERVGYVLTTQGAMEHPTNICYPDGIADGTLQYESIMAHELGHHWFGDLITCRRAEEMYINEGGAEYLSYLFLEDLYGRPAYDAKVRTVHHDMVGKAHLTDGGWYALSEMPQNVTYGDHTYRKGADVLHTLRSCLGDSLFEAGFKRVLLNNAFSDMSTTELRDSLSVATGVDLTSFFSDHIEQPGWAAFEIDSVISVQNGNVWDCSVHVEQKTRHADHLYSHEPTTLTFESATGERWNHPSYVILGGEHTVITSSPPFQPVFAYLNADARLAWATTVALDTITGAGSVNLSLADMSLVVQSMPEPMSVRAEEFWVAADQLAEEPFAYVIGPDRWWRLTGHMPVGAEIDARFVIDGRPNSATLYDPLLVQSAGGVSFIEDSLVLLYRPNAHFPWAEFANTTVATLGSHTDGYARLTATNAPLGDYAAGWRKSVTGVGTLTGMDEGWNIYPNPSDGHITIQAPLAAVRQHARVVLQDAEGRILMERAICSTITKLDASACSNGIVYANAVVPGRASIALGPVTFTR